MESNHALDWPRNFPKGYGHTSIAYLKRCFGYSDAKNGSIDAARYVVNQCVKEKRIITLVQTYPNAWLLPVISRNMLPLALAERIGLPIYYRIRCVSTDKRSRMSAMERLLHKPEFAGCVVCGRNYIIVDDVVTQGGTVSALRRMVCQQGGYIVAVVALAYAIGSSIIVPKVENLLRLILKFGGSIGMILDMLGVSGTLSLTNAQVMYICRFSRFKNFVKKITSLN